MWAIFRDDGSHGNGLAPVSHQGLFDFSVCGVVCVTHLAFRGVDIFTESVTADGNVLGEVHQVFVC
ncbi:hypothetical protein C1S82_31205 [Mycolicibacterium cosmeticum]|nr:hypothetical protein C1S82_31205 [Mycolicibacterium cosmeticum]